MTNLYDSLLPFQPKTIVDAGANVGFASLFFKLKYPSSEIVAIEIEDNNVQSIKKNMQGFANFELLQNALFNKKHFLRLKTHTMQQTVFKLEK